MPLATAVVGKRKTGGRRSSIVECPELIVEEIEALREERDAIREAMRLLAGWICRRKLESPGKIEMGVA